MTQHAAEECNGAPVAPEAFYAIACDPRRSVANAADGTETGKFVSRAQGAHANGLESWPQFAIAVLMAHAAGVDRESQDVAATVYLLARLAYTWAYLNGTTGKRAMLRSALWFVGFGACGWLAGKAAAKRLGA